LQEEYIFERLNAERLKDMQYLYKACFNESVSIEFLRKKYDTKNSGAEYTGYIAYSAAGAPAAYYGVFPCKVLAEGKSVLAAQSGDTMTHPYHRGKGLFIKLAVKTYELCRSLGIGFVFGFPNENSYPGFVKKLAWIHREDLQIYKLKVTTLPLAYVCGKVPVLSGMYKWYSGIILSGRKSKKKFFANSFAEAGYYGVDRSADFFEYKSGEGRFMIEVLGKNVHMKVSSALRIGDIESCSPEEFVQILKKLKTLARLLGCYGVIFYYSPNALIEPLLTGVSEKQKGLPVGWVDLGSGLDLNKLKFAQMDLDTY
jgi:hypothetical protein